MNQEQSSLQQKVNDKSIIFTSNRHHLTENHPSCPVSSVKTIPKWYKDADIYAIDPQTNKPYIDPQDGGKIPTWKSCPALLDVMSSGYVLRTPCDIEFYYDNNRIRAKVLDKQNKDFIDERSPMPQFVTPMGYDDNHFAWWMNWAVTVPEGYSVLYTHPMNRFDLPFITTSGVVDSDKVLIAGTIPFFLFKGWTGVLPAGTPYSQLFPFKRENWSSDIKIENPERMYTKNMINTLRFRVKNGGVYKNKIWKRRSYK